jgi:diguanylate cyclase (GGDEF)-like protein
VSWKDYRDPVAAALKGPGGVAVFPRPENPFEAFDPASALDLFRTLAGSFDLAVADAGADVGAVHWPVLVRAADEILLVADCDEKAVFRVKQFLAKHGPLVAGKCRLVVNQREEKSRYRPRDVARALGGEFAFLGTAAVPFSREAAKGRALAAASSKDPVGKAVRALAAELTGAAPAGEGAENAPVIPSGRKAAFLLGRFFSRGGKDARNEKGKETVGENIRGENPTTEGVQNRNGVATAATDATEQRHAFTDGSEQSIAAAEEMRPAAGGGVKDGRESISRRAEIETAGEPAETPRVTARKPGGSGRDFKILMLGKPVMNASPYVAARGWRVVLDPADGPDVALADDRGARYAPPSVPLVVVTDSPAAVWLIRQARPDAAFVPTVEEAFALLEDLARRKLKERIAASMGMAGSIGKRKEINPIKEKNSPVYGGVPELHAGVEDVASDAADLSEEVASAGIPPERNAAAAETAAAASGGQTDALTGCLTRGALQAVMPEGPFSVVFIDLDGFKEVNDTLGHETGDRVLAAFGRMLVENLKGRDAAVRWGGDEFVLILPGTRKRDAERVAANLKEAWERSAPDTGRLKVGFSAGVCEASGPEGFAAAVKEADWLMYEAKRAKKAARGAARQKRAVLSVPRHGALFVVCPSRPALAGEAAVGVLRQITGRKALVCGAPNSQAALVLGIPMERLVLADWRVPGSEAPVEHAGTLVWAVDPYKFLRASDVSVQRLVDEVSPLFELTVVDCGGDLSLCSSLAAAQKALVMLAGGPDDAAALFWLDRTGGRNVAAVEVGGGMCFEVEAGEKNFNLMLSTAKG